MMKPVEQFMQEFFDDRARFNQKYYDLFLGAANDGSEERLESAKAFGSFATAITRIDVGTHYSRLRYHLRPEGENWKIEKVNFQCGRCRGTGTKPDSDETCARCK